MRDEETKRAEGPYPPAHTRAMRQEGLILRNEKCFHDRILSAGR
jgi:hypothetical protein